MNPYFVSMIFSPHEIAKSEEIVILNTF